MSKREKKSQNVGSNFVLFTCLIRDREPCLRGYGASACRISQRFVETAAAPFLLRSLYEQVANRATQNHPEVHQKALAAQVSASVIFSVVLPGISHCSMKSCPWQEQRETDTAGCTYQNSQDTDMLSSPLAPRGKKQYHHWWLLFLAATKDGTWACREARLSLCNLSWKVGLGAASHDVKTVSAKVSSLFSKFWKSKGKKYHAVNKIHSWGLS